MKKEISGFLFCMMLLVITFVPNIIADTNVDSALSLSENAVMVDDTIQEDVDESEEIQTLDDPPPGWVYLEPDTLRAIGFEVMGKTENPYCWNSLRIRIEPTSGVMNYVGPFKLYYDDEGTEKAFEYWYLICGYGTFNVVLEWSTSEEYHFTETFPLILRGLRVRKDLIP